MQAKQSTAERRTVDGASGHFGALPDSLAAAPQPIGPEALVRGGNPV